MAEDPELERIRQEKLKRMMKQMAGTADPEWPGKPVVLGDQTMGAFVKRYPVAVIDCWAPWCTPCRMIAPIVEELAKEYRGKVAFGKLNIDENQMTAIQNDIMSIPTLLVYKKGRLVDRIVGAMPKRVLEAKIAPHLG